MSAKRIGRNRIVRRVRWLLLALSLAPRLDAQIAGGALRGAISDPSGDAIQGSIVSIKGQSTGIVRTVATTSAGLYQAVNLPVGEYTLTVSAPGFSTEERTGIVLQVGSDTIVDVQLALKPFNQTVTAVAAPDNLDLDTSQLSAVDSGSTIRELPLNGRDWTTLAALAPSVSIVTTENPPELNVNRGNRGLGVMMAIGGARPEQTSYWLDGINVNDYAGGGPGDVLGLSLGVDAIEEFAVITSNAPANYGTTSGGVINAVTRAGSNEIHGSAYDFLRNSALDARNFFDGPNPPPFRRNQYGAALSGPIKRHKTFAFVNYEGIRQSLGVTTVNTVPSANVRAGNLVAGPLTVNPLVAPYLALFPLPNGPVNGDTGAYSFAAQNDTTEDFVITRFDHEFSKTDQIHGTYLFDTSTTTGPDNFDGVLLGTLARRQTASVEESHVVSGSAVNFLRVGLNRVVTEQVRSLSAINPLAADSTFGFLPGRDPGEITIAGVSQYPGGIGASGDYHFHFTSYQIFDDLAFTRGAHALTVGVSVEDVRSNILGAGTNNGNASFGSLAAFLTDQPSSFAATLPGTNVPVGLRQTIAGAYIKDDWRIARNVTLNLGLRYEMATVPSEEHNRLATLTLGSPGLRVGSPLFQNPTRLDFSPLVGLAWDPFRDGKTAVRAAFGQYNSLPLTGIFGLIAVLSAPFDLQASSTSAAPGSFPGGLYESLAAGGPRADSIQQNPRRSYVFQWNFSVERQIARALTAEVGYAGSHGVHLPAIENDINTVPPTALTPTGYLWPVPRGSGSKPWPGWGNVTAVLWEVSSVYDALHARLEKRFVHGLTGQMSYTWSKGLDIGSNSLPTAYTNTVSNLPIFNPHLLRSVSDFDVPQTLVLSGNWEIPVHAEKSKVAAGLFSGWQVGSLITLSSGLPFTPTIAGDPLGLNSSQPYDFPDRLNSSGCANPINPGNPAQYIKLSCFAAPHPATLLGDAGRNVARGPGLFDWAASIFRNIPIARFTEMFRIQFRAEMFNTFNHANFNPPTSTSLQLFTQSLSPITSAGNLTSTATTSRQLQFGLKILW
jgi:hypothetical protein